MVYVLSEGEIKAIECYSSFRTTDINKNGLSFIPGENTISAEL